MTKYLGKDEVMKLVNKEIEERLAAGENLIPCYPRDYVSKRFHEEDMLSRVSSSFVALKNGNLLCFVRKIINLQINFPETGNSLSETYELRAGILKEGEYTETVKNFNIYLEMEKEHKKKEKKEKKEEEYKDVYNYFCQTFGITDEDNERIDEMFEQQTIEALKDLERKGNIMEELAKQEKKPFAG